MSDQEKPSLNDRADRLGHIAQQVAAIIDREVGMGNTMVLVGASPQTRSLEDYLLAFAVYGTDNADDGLAMMALGFASTVRTTLKAGRPDATDEQVREALLQLVGQAFDKAAGAGVEIRGLEFGSDQDPASN